MVDPVRELGPELWGSSGRTPLAGDFMARLVLGGPNLGADTLTRFFALHMFILPGLVMAMLALMPHGLEDYVIILGPLLAGAALIALPFIASRGERAPRRRPWAVAGVAAAAAVVGVLTIAGKNANWSPRFDRSPLPAAAVASVDPGVRAGAVVFHDRACIDCHRIAGHGGRRGPDLTHVASRLTGNQLKIRILNGGYNMPAYGAILSPGELDTLTAFLESRR